MYAKLPVYILLGGRRGPFRVVFVRGISYIRLRGRFRPSTIQPQPIGLQQIRLWRKNFYTLAPQPQNEFYRYTLDDQPSHTHTHNSSRYLYVYVYRGRYKLYFITCLYYIPLGIYINLCRYMKKRYIICIYVCVSYVYSNRQMHCRCSSSIIDINNHNIT